VEDASGRDRSFDFGDFLTGFLTGAIVGAATAMILTPQSGDDLRHLLRATWRQASNRARDAAADLNDRASDQRETNT
jgi:gas vesicle protein